MQGLYQIRSCFRRDQWHARDQAHNGERDTQLTRSHSPLNFVFASSRLGRPRQSAPTSISTPTSATIGPPIMKNFPHLSTNAALASGFFETGALPSPTNRNISPIKMTEAPSLITH